MKTAGIALIAAALWASGAAAAPLQLRDPFVQPAPRSAPPPPPTAEAAAVAAASAWKPELRAIMYDQARSLVNVSGSVLAIGESVRGYRLVKVNERSVVMDKGGAAIKLTLDNREISQ